MNVIIIKRIKKMNSKDFNKAINAQIDTCVNLLTSKGAEYSTVRLSDENCDRLAHFKKAAAIMDTTPKQALMGMLSKHLVSVSGMCAGGKYSAERWSEKITDSINYLLILRAMVEEEIDEKN